MAAEIHQYWEETFILSLWIWEINRLHRKLFLLYLFYQATQNKKKKQAQQDFYGIHLRLRQATGIFEDLLKKFPGWNKAKKPTPELSEAIPEQANNLAEFWIYLTKTKSDSSSFINPQSSYAPKRIHLTKSCLFLWKPASTYGKALSTYGKLLSTYETCKVFTISGRLGKSRAGPMNDEISYYEGCLWEKSTCTSERLSFYSGHPYFGN